MKEIFDEFSFAKHSITITKDKHLVPGLGNFTHYNAPRSPESRPTHYHSDIIEIHCMIKGQRQSHILENNSYKIYTYTGNEVFITFPNEIHGTLKQQQFPCEYYALQVNVHNPSCMLGLNPEYSRILCNNLLHLPDRHLRMGTTHIHYLRTAFNFFAELNPSAIQIGVQFLTCFLFSLHLLLVAHSVSNQNFSKQIENTLLYLQENIHEPIQVSDLAAISGYSLSHYKVKFKNEIGITPAEYINIQKIEYAKKQLLETNISITELAYDFGFSSSNYFCSVFKKYFKVTPSEYRKMHQQSAR